MLNVSEDTAKRDLICDHDLIFDRKAFTAKRDAAFVDAEDNRALRAVTVALLKEAIDAGRAEIKAAFEAMPHNARPTVRAYAYLTDQIVRQVFAVATEHLHPKHNPSEGERLSLLAVGGYGRGEMAPYSDVDLLFLTPYKITGWAESVIESMLYIFWDLHLKVGHSSRTVKDCLRLGREDFTIRNSPCWSTATSVAMKSLPISSPSACARSFSKAPAVSLSRPSWVSGPSGIASRAGNDIWSSRT